MTLELIKRESFVFGVLDIYEELKKEGYKAVILEQLGFGCSQMIEDEEDYDGGKVKLSFNKVDNEGNMFEEVLALKFNCLQDLVDALKNDSNCKIEGNDLLNLMFIFSKENNFKLDEINDKLVAISTKKNEYIELSSRFSKKLIEFSKIKIGDITTFGEFEKEMEYAYNLWEEDHWRKEDEFYNSMNNRECSNCRGGGCVHCETSRFL